MTNKQYILLNFPVNILPMQWEGYEGGVLGSREGVKLINYFKLYGF